MDTDQLQRLDRFLADPKIPQADKDAAVAAARQQQAGAKPQPVGAVGQFLRSSPAMAGAIKGGELGYKLGSPFGGMGKLAGAGLGAGGGAILGELGMIGGQKALGLPEGSAPIGPRLKGAGESGIFGELGGRALGAAGRGVLSRLGGFGQGIKSALGKVEEFGIPLGAGEQRAARYAATRGASGVITRAARTQSNAIRQAAEEIIGRIGQTSERSAVLREGTRAIRQVTKALEPIFKSRFPQSEQLAASRAMNAPAYEQLLQQLGLPAGTDLLDVMKRTASNADIAEKLSAIPGGMEAIGQRFGVKAQMGIAQDWLATTLAGATGQTGLRKGLVDPERILRAWDALSPLRQRNLFGQAAGEMGTFMDALRQVQVAGAAGRKAVPPINWTKILGGLGGALTGVGGAFGAGRAAETGIGAAVGGGLSVLFPWIAARILTSPGGAEMLAQRLGGPGMETAARLFPQAARFGSQAVAQTANQP